VEIYNDAFEAQDTAPFPNGVNLLREYGNT
jgi:hypothetical protein